MPKQKITKDMVLDAAFALARTGGPEQMTVKNIAEKLGCSVQPIYSYCHNMGQLRQEVNEKVRQFIQEYVAVRMDKDDLFRSTGRAYIQLAKEEPSFLKMFVFQERKHISSLNDLYQNETNPQMAQAIADTLSISVEKARRLHLHMLIYTMGLGMIFSVAIPGIPAEEIYTQQEQAYQAFLKAVGEDSENG